MKKRNKKHSPVSPLRKIFDGLLYKIKDNNLTCADSYGLLTTYQHIYFVQSVAKKSGWKYASIHYLNSVKLAIERALMQIVKHSRLNDDDVYVGDLSQRVTVYKQTRGKIAWFILRYLPLTNEWLRNMPDNQMAKHLKYAREMLDISLSIKDNALRKFINQ